MASFANDACGSPIPWQFTCPWEFFDGKIFHLKMIMASSNRPLLDVCDGQTTQLLQVERMRDAILASPAVSLSRPRFMFSTPAPPMLMSSNNGADYGHSNAGAVGRGGGMGRGIRPTAPSGPGRERAMLGESRSYQMQQSHRVGGKGGAGGVGGMAQQMSRQEAVQQEAHAYTNYHFRAQQLMY